MNANAARLLGSLAFAAGLDCAPALDASFVATLEGRRIGDKRTAAEMKAWIAGYQAALLAANTEVACG